jgi:PAS domain S-box-containing protein
VSRTLVGKHALALLVAVGAPAAAMGIALAASLDARPGGALLLFLLAVIVATVVGGPWHGLTATTLSVPAIVYFFLPPTRSFEMTTNDWLRLGLYCAAAAAISVFLGRARQARRDAERVVAERDEALGRVRSSERRLVETLEDTETGAWEWDVAADAFAGSANLGPLLGMPEEEPASSYGDFLRVVHPADRARVAEAGERARRDGAEAELEFRVVRSDGTVRWIWNRGTVVRDDAGRPAKLRGLVRDVTERRRREEGMRLVAEASELLLGSDVVQDALRSVARLAVQDFADWCSITVGEPGSPATFVSVAHADPDRSSVAGQIRTRLRRDWATFGLVGDAVATGRARLVEDAGAALAAAAVDGEQRRLLQALELRSAIAAPLVDDEGVCGLVTLLTAESGYRFGEHDLAIAEELARRSARALTAARLRQRERWARELAERSSMQRLRLQAVTESLAAALTPSAVADVVVREGLTALEADFAAVYLMRDDGYLELAGSAGYPDELLEGWREVPVEAGAPASDAARSGELLVFERLDEIVARYPSFQALADQAGERAAIAAPILSTRGALGVLHIGFRAPRTISADARALALTLARQCAQALERARLFEAERAYRSGIDRILEIVPRIQAGGSPAEVARAICRAAIDTFGADAAQVFDVERDVVRLVHREPPSPALREGTRIRRDDMPGLDEALAELRPMFVADVLEEVRGTALEHAQATGLRSSLRIPISVGGAADRLLILSWTRVVARPDATTVALMRRFADQAALAVEQAERIEAEAVAARTAGRVATLQQVTGQLSAALTVEQVIDVAAGQGLSVLGAQAGVIAILAADGFELELAAAVGYEDAAPEKEARIPIDAQLPLAEAVRERRTVVVRSPAERLGRYPATDLSRAGREGVLVACPFLVGDRVIGGLGLVLAEGRDVDGEDVAFIESFASQAAQALERAHLYRREHSIAETLQRSVVPDELSEPERLAVAARYLPGSDGLDVGGDWYDLIELAGGSVCFAVGDVVGKGVEAAAMMAQLRNALRAYALEGFGPAAILERLNRLAQISGAQFATLLVIELEPATGECRVAVAGHPPLLVIGPDGTADYLDGGGALPLGVLEEVDYREATLRVDPGSTLLLYTDGLVESRRSSLDDGLAKLRDSASGYLGSVDGLVDHLLGSLLEERQDDVALLAVRLESTAAELLDLRVPSQLDALPAVREELRSWLDRVGVSPDEAHDICLASWEACANAVEHAQNPSEPLVDLLAEEEGSEIRIRVRDYGHWRLPQVRPERGLGLKLMEGLMDELDIQASDGGTVVCMRRRLDAGVPR